MAEPLVTGTKLAPLPGETPINTAPQGFIPTVMDQMVLNPSSQFAITELNQLGAFVSDSFTSVEAKRQRDADWDPLAPENIKGFEPYADWLVGTRNKPEADLLKARIRSNETREEAIGREGTWATGLVAGALDPINLTPLGAPAKGATLLRSALTMGASNAALSVGMDVVDHFTNPTSQIDGAATRALYAGVFGAALGGFVARAGKSLPHELGDAFSREQNNLDRALGQPPLETPKEAAPRERSAPVEPEPVSREAPHEPPVPMEGVEVHESRGISDEDRAQIGKLLDRHGIEVDGIRAATKDARELAPEADYGRRRELSEEVLRQWEDRYHEANAAPVDANGNYSGIRRDADLPDWFGRVEATVNDLADRFGIGDKVRLWTGDADHPGRSGLSFQNGHIVIGAHLDEAKAVAVAMHELGHQVEFHRLRSADPAVQRAVREAWQRESAASAGKSVEELRPITDGDHPMAGQVTADAYHHNFHEWFAEQVSRFLTTTKEPSSIVDRFFAGIADAWRAIYQRVTGHTPLTAEVDDFMRGIWRDDHVPGQRGAVPHMEAHAAELIRDGMGVPDVSPFKVEPTMERYGIAPAGGLERVAPGPVASLIRMGVKAIGDLAQSIGGDASFMTTDNLKGVATPPSVKAYSGWASARAVDLSANLQAIWNEMRGHTSGLQVGGLNVTATGTRIADLARDITGRRNGQMTFGEFEKEVARAQMTGKVDPALPPEIAKAVGKAVPMLDGFFKLLGDEATKVGLFGTPEVLQRRMNVWQTQYREWAARFDELSRIPEDQRTGSHAAQMARLQDGMADMSARLHGMELRGIEPDDALRKTIDGMMQRGAARREAATNLAAKMRAELVTRFETDMAVRDALRTREEERGLTPAQSAYLKRLDERLAQAERDAVNAYHGDQPAPGAAPASPAQKRLLDRLDEIASGPALTDLQHAYVDQMMKAIFKGEFKLPVNKTDPRYFTRRWNQEAISLNRKGLIDRFETWYREQGDAEPRARAEKSVDAIQAHDPESHPVDWDQPWIEGQASSQMARKFDIPNEKVIDFIKTGVSEVATDYARTMGPRIEMARRFGDPHARLATQAVLAHAAGEMSGSAEAIEAALVEAKSKLDFLKNDTIGTLRANQPLTATAASVRAVKNAVSLSSLGRVGFAAMIEGARPVMMRGLGTFQLAFEALGNLKAIGEMTHEVRMLNGEMVDAMHGTIASKVMEAGGVASRGGSEAAMAIDKATSKFNNFAENGFYILNGLSLITDFLKGWATMASAHYMIEDIKAVAAGKASVKQRNVLASYGIGAEDAAAMAGLGQFDRAGMINLPNLRAWNDDRLAAMFANAVGFETRRAVVTPRAADKTFIQQGWIVPKDGSKPTEHPFLTLPFQFMSWGIAANNKVLLSAAQGRDASVISGSLAMVGMAYLAMSLKGGSGWDNGSFTDRLGLAVDQSGLLASFSDINSMAESMSAGAFGVRPMLGMAPKYGHQPDGSELYTAPFGPAGSKAYDLWQAFTDPSMDMHQRSGALRRLAPLNQIHGFSETYGLLQSAVGG